jgi:hypothetical protein
MKKLGIITSILLASQIFASSFAFADYQPQDDVVINIGPDIGLNLNAVTAISSLSFDTQQQIHEAVMQTTGIDFDYHYIWLNVLGKTVVGIDPPQPSW